MNLKRLRKALSRSPRKCRKALRALRVYDCFRITHYGAHRPSIALVVTKSRRRARLLFRRAKIRGRVQRTKSPRDSVACIVYMGLKPGKVRVL